MEKLSDLPGYTGSYLRGYIHRCCRPCAHGKIYVYPEIHGADGTSAHGRKETGGASGLASFKWLRQDHHDGGAKVCSKRSGFGKAWTGFECESKAH